MSGHDKLAAVWRRQFRFRRSPRINRRVESAVGFSGEQAGDRPPGLGAVVGMGTPTHARAGETTEAPHPRADTAMREVKKVHHEQRAGNGGLRSPAAPERP